MPVATYDNRRGSRNLKSLMVTARAPSRLTFNARITVWRKTLTGDGSAIHQPIHPGEILLEEFMKPLGISQNRLARELKVPPRRINEIVHGKRGMSIDTALRLSRHFGTTPQFWINLQTHYELEIAEDTNLVETISKEVSPRTAADPTG